jgi:Fe-S-cluster containining protein
VAEPPEDCLRCAACCFSELYDYVRVTGDDFARLGPDAERMTVFIGNRAFMRMTHGHCAALVPDAESGTLSCSVYDRRPTTCRELERGGPACAGERWAKGDRPLLLLRRMRA